MKLFLPDASLRSPTAVQGTSDMRDENVFSALVLQTGGAGNQTLFTNPRGQAIPSLRGAAIAATPNQHQSTYTELTTNITQSGQLGSSIGDASFRAIGITIENAYYGPTTGLMNAYGAGQQEVAEILAKTFFQIRIGGKLQVQGPVLAFPASGGLYGGISASGIAAPGAVQASVNNGWPGSMRRLKLPILVARTDTVEATYGVAGGSSLVFSTPATPGQPTLVWVNIHALVKGDAR